MPAILGNIIVIAVLAAAAALAIRSLWKSHKSGGGCNGDCASCRNRHPGRNKKHRRCRDHPVHGGEAD